MSRDTNRIKAAERARRALELRGRGRTYRQIAAELGYSDGSAAKKAVDRAIVAIPRDAADSVREIELARLDQLMAEATRVLEQPHVTVSQGRVVMFNGSPLPDHAPVLAAISTILKIMERRAKLLGLDAPTRTAATVVTEDMVDAEIKRLERVLAEREDLD